MEMKWPEVKSEWWKLTAMQPAVFDGVTKREERNGGAYSKTKRLTVSSTKMLSCSQRCRESSLGRSA